MMEFNVCDLRKYGLCNLEPTNPLLEAVRLTVQLQLRLQSHYLLCPLHHIGSNYMACVAQW